MGTKISDLPAASAVAGANLLPIVQSGVTNKATVTQLFTSPALVTPDLGTPTTLVGTNITGTATAFNINGTVGATTAAVGSFTQANVSSKILVGGPTSTVGVQGIQVYGSSATGAANVVQRAFANDANGANLLLVKTRGTTSTSADLVSNDDTLGQIQFFGSNGTAPSNTALVYGKIGPSATWGATSATSLPTLIGFSTTNTGSTTASTRMIIDPDGAVNVYANVRVNQLSAIPAGGSQSQSLNFSSTANFGVFYGSGVPTLSAAQGSLYLRSDGSSTSTRMYVNTNGSTTWTAVTTAA
jgi:hypothetical protein